MTWKQATIDREKMRFDDAADIYDYYRPGYPQAIIDAVHKLTVNVPHPEVLEIGAGSGKATGHFADFGYRITCVEPGESLVAKGMEHFIGNPNIKYMNTTFEDIEVPENSYDLIYAAQSFHWVRKPYGYSKMARLLRSGGHSALFWNRYLETDSQESHDIAQLCSQYHLLPMMPMDQINVMNDSQYRELNQCGFYDKVEVLHVPWTRKLSYDNFLGFLQTGNGWLGLCDADKVAVGKKLEALFDSIGGTYDQTLVCSLFIASVK